MDRPLSIVIVRHAESERNEAKKGATYFADDDARQKVKGIPDDKISLTAKGIWQAESSSQPFREKFGIFDYVYHSGYKRTIQTMDGLLSAYSAEEKEKMKIRLNPFIHERHPGFTYDMTIKEAEKHFPYLKEYWNTFGGFHAQPPGGESLAQVIQRVYIFINMLFRDRKDKRILVVTHGGTLRCFRFILERWTFDQAKSWPKGQSPKNCGITSYKFNFGTKRLELEQYNETFW